MVWWWAPGGGGLATLFTKTAKRRLKNCFCRQVDRLDYPTKYFDRLNIFFEPNFDKFIAIRLAGEIRECKIRQLTVSVPKLGKFLFLYNSYSIHRTFLILTLVI